MEKTVCALVTALILLVLFDEMYVEMIAYKVASFSKAVLTAFKNRPKLLADIALDDEKKSCTSLPKQASYTNRTCAVNIQSNNFIIQVPMQAPSWEDINAKFAYLSHGGHYVPKNCSSPDKVAVVVPYRDREAHLRILLNNIHPFLTGQELDYTIFVVEQSRNQTFNKGKLLNVGFVEAMKLYDWQCILLHDVDLLPEDRRNLHLCPRRNPRHMAVAMDKFNYKLPYEMFAGGSSMFNVKQYRDVNGMSNRYWGWGGEDDDLYTRTLLAGYKMERYNATIARYKMIVHESDIGNPINPCRFELLKLTKEHWQMDGLSSLRYRLINVGFKPVYTHISVDLLEDETQSELDREHCKKNPNKILWAMNHE